MNPHFDVVTFGEAMVMFVADEPGELHQIEHFSRKMAGAEANVAVGLSRLGFKVGWMSKLGRDPLGKYISSVLNSEQVNMQAVLIQDDRSTGFQLKAKAVSGGDPQVQYFRRFSAASTMSIDDFDASYYLGARHIHLTGIAPALSDSCYHMAESIMKQAGAAGIPITFDPNLRPTLWPGEEAMKKGINRLAAQADWVLPGLSEGTFLTGFTAPSDIAAFYLDQGAKGVCIKLGPEGAYCRTREEACTVPGFKIAQVLDTVGAGDAFAAGFISGLLSGLSLMEAVRRGNAMGALAVTSTGDSDGLPAMQQLLEFMNSERSAQQ
ncbi:sugar kinase [Paenibacillus abyssi]|uniref:Sugar kinase n=1 Tax=Paenibacillus abyssi TaxID=1340531 RepID=A0A917FV31_9BACL|nr:sugar kinase [Paenibacillus abyssi]GGG03916.1 sugar kinase [Paenibacillus abyssi]